MTFVGERLFDLLAAFAVLIALFVPLERTFAARRQPHLRRELTVDLAYFAFQYLAMMGLLLAFNAWLQAKLAVLPALNVRALPLAAQAVIAVVCGDLLLYWGHRACHRIPLLWRFHAVHHSSQQLDWLAAHREHPLDGLWSQWWLNLPACLLGVDLAALAPLYVLRGVWAIFVHSNVRMPLGPLGLLLGDPALHRWHHARVARTEHNFANLAPYLDVLFGTHHRPADERYPLGIAGIAAARRVSEVIAGIGPAQPGHSGEAWGPSAAGGAEVTGAPE